MANNSTAVKLGAELSRRCLSDAETKPKLAESNVSVGKRKQRESRNDNKGVKKVKAIMVFRDMGIRQLREQAILRGITSSGSRRELLDRLCTFESEKEHKEFAVEHKDKEEKETSKEETKSTRGTAVLDPYLPDHIKTQYHVLERGCAIYDATLNQTNVCDNSNKFYVIQALESNNGGNFMLYTGWGRVGVKGQDKLQGPYASVNSVVQEFEAKFYAKTKNHWSNRKEFINHPKSYVLLEMDYDADKESDIHKKTTVESKHQATKLDPQIANLVSLICNTDMMKQKMQELGLNIEKLPLGKLSRSTILKGYDVLRKISDVIDNSDREKLRDLSGEFYTIIPHDFGFRNMRDFIIDTQYKLKCKLEMVEALGEIEVATSLFKDSIYSKEDPLYSHYQCLRCELTPLHVGSVEFSMFSDTKNRMLLWHGSGLTNWTGILSQGLRIAPPEAPSRGYSFGKGLYFADMFAKSAPYSGAHSDAVLVLCEVALGDINEIQTIGNYVHHLPKGKLSSKAIGRTIPDPSQAQVLEDGVIVPLGKPMDQTELKAICFRNEYIISNEDQICIRYVIHVKFCYNTTG